jgi:hypothetical protein
MKFLSTLVFTSFMLGGWLNSAPTKTEPTVSNYREWIEYIRPTESEGKWRAIAWRNKLMPAVEEAKKLDRPILLWAMNGNPCGET